MNRVLLAAFVVLAFSACSAARDTAVPAAVADASHGDGSIEPSASGNVFVANWYDNTVTVYSAGAKARLRAITSGVEYPNALAINGSGGLYVGNYGAPSGSITSDVVVYGGGGGAPNRTITQGVRGPYSIAFGNSGKLYVANYGASNVTVYGRGSDSVLQTITNGVRSPEVLAFNKAGNLYVANWSSNSVTVYGPGSSSR